MVDKDSILIAEINTNVKYLRESFDEHIDDYKSLKDNVIRPLYDESQRRKGAATMGKALWTVFMATIAAVSGYFGGHH